MTVIEEHLRASVMALSRSLFVTITTRGCIVAPMHERRAADLTYPDLELLLALTGPVDRPLDEVVTAVAGETGASQDGLWQTLRTVADRRRLAPPAPDVTLSPLVTGSASPRPTGSVDEARSADLDEQLVLLTPIAAMPTALGFAFLDHDGNVVALLDARELLAASSFRWPSSVEAAHATHTLDVGDVALDRAAFTSVASDLLAAGLLAIHRPEQHDESPQGRALRDGALELERLNKLVDSSERGAEERKALRDAARADGQRTKTLVVPYNKAMYSSPLALGYIFAYARVHDGGALLEQYELEPNWIARKPHIRGLLEEGPAVFLFSNYVWSHADNLAVSAMVKRLSPDSITIHGGPDTPKYPADTERYLRDNPHVDVAVRGEGEIVTSEVLAALDGRLVGRNGDLSDLRGVAGISFRRAPHIDAEIVRTDDRERIADLDVVPSPYLTGVFDVYAESTMSLFIIETTRGCPYSCTFCDWGSATNSRIRKFSLDRVFDELEWAAKHGMPRLFIADANFGILPRDAEIAEHIAKLKRTYDYPKDFGTSYAKNTTKHLEKIVATCAEAGVIAEGVLSFQSTDPATLEAVDRSNIKISAYEDLATTFRRAGLPLFVDLMMGLPGSTPESFQHDLQRCADQEVPARIYRTELLVNSPMNDPRYREKHQIDTATRHGQNIRVGRPLLISTATYTAAEFEQMDRLRKTYTLGESYSLFRHVARFVRRETLLPESEFYLRLDRTVRADTETYPFLSWAIETVPELLSPPVSWHPFTAELGRFVVDEIGVEPSTALDAVLDVQRAHLPARQRSFPCRLVLAHDYAAWFDAVLAAKEEGEDWCSVVPRLITFGPGELTVDDPTNLCAAGLGYHIDNDLYGVWELQSPISRPMPARHLLVD